MTGALHAKNIGGAAGIAALLLCACASADAPDDKALATAYGEQLLRSDLRRMVPPDATPEDSAALAQRVIDNWLRSRVLLHKAEENLTEEQKDVDRQLREYRESLITYAYEQALVRQKLDTSVTEEDINAYYQQNIKNFELRDDLVRVRWFKLREKDRREVRKVEELWRASGEEDRHKLEVLIAQRGSTINDTHEDWMPFNELQQLVPLRVENPTDWIPRQSKVMADDSVNTYFVEFIDHRLKNSTTPIELARDGIRAILINQRKLQLIERMREDLYQDALARKDVSVH